MINERWCDVPVDKGVVSGGGAVELVLLLLLASGGEEGLQQACSVLLMSLLLLSAAGSTKELFDHLIYGVFLLFCSLLISRDHAKCCIIVRFDSRCDSPIEGRGGIQ